MLNQQQLLQQISYGCRYLAVLLRDIFYEYNSEDLKKYKLIFKQCNRPNGYFNVAKANKPDTYISSIKINKKSKYIKESKSKEVCALAYNEFIKNNNIDLPLNIVPLYFGVFENGKWYCNLY